MGSFVNKLSTWTPVGRKFESTEVNYRGGLSSFSEAVVLNNYELRNKVLDAVEQQRRLTWTAEGLGLDV